MTRFRIGLTLLMILLVLGITAQIVMGSLHDPVAEQLNRAAGLALLENWEEARGEAAEAASCWQKSWRLSAALADHQPMEDIDSLFAQLPARAAAEDPAEFAAACAELARRVEAMADAHRLNWWNLL